MPTGDRRKRGTNPRARGTNPRAMGTNPRALGINPRALGTNPKVKGTNPRALREQELQERYTQPYPVGYPDPRVHHPLP